MAQIDIDKLLQKFDTGQTSLEEEAQIQAWLAIHGDNAPYKEYQAFFEHLNQAKISLETATKDIVIPVDFENQKEITPKIISFNHHWRTIAAGFLLLLLGTSVGWFLNQGNNNQIIGLQQEVMSIKQLLLHSQVEPLAASYRMDLVEEVIQQPQMNSVLLETLSHIIEADKNINVRITAIEGLALYAHQADVQEVLLKTLNEQQDANIQMLLIDILTRNQVKKAKPQLKKLIENKEVFDFVKTQARQTLKSL